MHSTQQKILDLARSIQINYKNPRAIGRLLGVKNPQNIKYHLEKLEKENFLIIDKITGIVSINSNSKDTIKKSENLIKIPIYGSASCGVATVFAEENIEGFQIIPSSKMNGRSSNGLFIIIADGDSLNMAKGIKDGPIENGDYVIIDGKNRNPNNGDYVLSIINGLANIKRFYKRGGRIELISESSQKIPPIFIDSEDFKDYMVNGIVIGVKKRMQ